MKNLVRILALFWELRRNKDDAQPAAREPAAFFDYALR
jgi:hypothetical protein